jgi:hypothetical protein
MQRATPGRASNGDEPPHPSHGTASCCCIFRQTARQIQVADRTCPDVSTQFSVQCHPLHLILTFSPGFVRPCARLLLLRWPLLLLLLLLRLLLHRLQFGVSCRHKIRHKC